MAWAGDEASFDEFVERHGLSFPQLSDGAGELYDHFAIPAQPAFVVIGRDGRATTILGSLDETTIDAALEAATAAS